MRHKFSVLAFFAVLLIIFILSKYGFLNVEVTDTSGNFTYSILNQENQKVTEIKTGSSKLKRLVPRGSYEVMVRSDGASALSIVKTGGFFGTSNAYLEPKPEKARQFIGSNPKPCMFLGVNLYSSECNNDLESLVRHVPPTDSRPGYTENVSLPLNGVREGLIRIDGGVYFLVQIFNEEEDSGTHTLYQFKDSRLTGRTVVLGDLDKSSTYSAQPYKAGFLVYKPDFSDIKYYAGIGTVPEDITMKASSLKNATPSLLSANGNGLLAVFSDARDEDVHDTDESVVRVRTEIIMLKNGSTKSLIFSGPAIADVVACGPMKLCVLEGDNLGVYDISGKDQRFLYKVTGVNDIVSMGKDLLAVREGEVLSINVANSGGYIDYNFADYQYCGLQAEQENYILCLINSVSQKSALLIDRSREDIDSIDKKISQIANLPEVTNVSAHGKYIYISPDLGPIVYLESIDGYGYDPDIRKSVSFKIDQFINKIGIDRSKYQIINTLE